jgi:hypothetical protein
VDPGGRPAWIELPTVPERLAEICLNGERSETTNPSLEELLQALDKIEKLALSKGELGNC